MTIGPLTKLGLIERLAIQLMNSDPGAPDPRTRQYEDTTYEKASILINARDGGRTSLIQKDA